MDAKGALYTLLSDLAKNYAVTACRFNEKNRILQITEYLQRHFKEPDLRMRGVSAAFHISESQLRRIFSAELGTSPAAYLSEIRMTKAKELLISRPELSVEQISVLCGFASVYYFSSAFRNAVGTPPANFRKRLGTTV